MISQHDEVEIKLDATSVDLTAFQDWAEGLHPSKQLHFQASPDTYYTQGDNVVRHRKDVKEKHHELTVKRRKSARSTRERLEVDLYFSKETVAEDVDAWLRAAGFSEKITLEKDSWIYHYDTVDPKITVILAIYDVWETGKREQSRRYIEVEVAKGSDVSMEEARISLKWWRDLIAVRFYAYAPPTPLNLSLYEIWTGERYQLVEEEKA